MMSMFLSTALTVPWVCARIQRCFTSLWRTWRCRLREVGEFFLHQWHVKRPVLCYCGWKGATCQVITFMGVGQQLELLVSVFWGWTSIHPSYFIGFRQGTNRVLTHRPIFSGWLAWSLRSSNWVLIESAGKVPATINDRYITIISPWAVWDASLCPQAKRPTPSPNLSYHNMISPQDSKRWTSSLSILSAQKSLGQVATGVLQLNEGGVANGPEKVLAKLQKMFWILRCTVLYRGG